MMTRLTDLELQIEDIPEHQAADAWKRLNIICEAFIADGHHVAWPSFQAAFRAIGPRRMMLVTDAMATIGSPRDAFELFGETIRVSEGRLVNAEGRLAGAQSPGSLASASRPSPSLEVARSLIRS